MTGERLIYLPLGGAGEVGMNCYVYGWGEPDRERLIVVDLGVTFPDMDGTPGVDLIFPDVSWLEERRDRIEGIFVTHAHEDHVGAVGHLWDRLRAPVHCRKFTAHHARRKMEEQGQDPNVVQVVDAFPASVEAGPMTVRFMPVSHSIPESSALVIDTPAGRILHTGDFKLDPTPVLGEPFDPVLWEEVSKGGIRALVCDSTNVAVGHPGRSEQSIRPAIRDLIEGAEGMVVATTFASNVARLKTLAEAARDAGRSVCVMGRAMQRMIRAGQETGLLGDFPATVSPEDALDIPRGSLMLIVTGSQGERRAASAQLARGKYLGHQLKEGDLFLFSSRTIPGNEAGVIKIINDLSAMGVDVVDDSTDAYHVSGHANRPDLERVHDLVRPGMLIPMHGEHRMLRAHAKLAEAKGLASVIAVNGTMLDLAGNEPRVVEHVETGRTYLDGSVKIGAMDGVVRDRIRMAVNGHAMVTLIIDEDGAPLGEPWVETMGLPEIGRSRSPLVDVLEADLSRLMGRVNGKVLGDDDALDTEIRRVLRNSANDEIGRKPEVTVVISRLAA
jgi:ribonuclease J